MEKIQNDLFKSPPINNIEIKASNVDPFNPVSEDIYKNDVEEKNINPEDVSTLKQQNQMNETEQPNEKDFDQDKSGDDLDVPGSELDDEQEAIGNEDEENNYYSIGGDNHNNLDEDKE